MEECYSENVKIGWIEYAVAAAIKCLDPISWDMAHSEYIDSQIEDGYLLSFDSGANYYWRCDVERFIRENE